MHVWTEGFLENVMKKDGKNMALLEKWRKMAYSETVDKKTLQNLWAAYFQDEKDIYIQLLTNPDEEVKGTVKELAEKYKIYIITYVL